MENVKIKLTSEAIALFDDKLLCVAMDANIVYTINPKNGEISLLFSIPEEDFFSARLIGSIIVCGEQIFFIPYHAKKIWIYDNRNDNWKGIQLNHESYRAQFWNAHLFENYIYMIPSKYPAIVRINIDTYEIEEFTECVTPDTNIKANYGYFFSNYMVKNEKLYLASCVGNYILKFCMKDMEYKWKEVGKKGNQYVGMINIGEKIWLAPRRNTAIVEWDINKDQIAEYDLPSQFIDEYNFLGISNRKNLYLPGIPNGKTLVFSIEDHTMRHEPDLPGHTFSDWLSKNIYVSYFCDGKVLIDDCGNERELYTFIDKNLIDYFLLEKFGENILKNRVLKENNLCNLQTFLKLIGGCEKYDNNKNSFPH